MTAPISGSEIDTWLKCGKLHDYQYNKKLELIKQGPGRRVGTAGHFILGAYYRALMSGADHQEAIAQAESMASWEVVAAGIDAEATEKALMCCRTYWAFYPSDEWEILAVEAEFRYGALACTIDLVVREQGELTIVDHRFLRETYDEDLVVIDPQLPRYATIMRLAGNEVTRAYRNMISTADTKAGRHRVSRLPIPLSAARLQVAQEELNQGSMHVIAARARMRTPIRTFNSLVCKHCDFRVPCAMSAEGQDEQPLLDLNYKVSTYGYAPS